MSFEVKLITKKETWDDFLETQTYTLMTQAWEYGDFYKSQGEEAWVLGVYDKDTLIGGAMLVSVHAKRGNFLFLPYGPIGEMPDEAHSVLFDYLKKKGKKEGYHFIRVSPFEDESVEKTYEKYGFRHAPIHMLAETTWLLDLSPQAEDLLKAMNKNHRNLIRRCERDGVIIKSFTDKKALEQFNVLHDETAKRHHFVRFSDSYVEKEFEAFSKEKQAVVFHAYLPDGRLDAAAVVYYYKHMASYRHGASLMLDKKHPSSYALQWAALNEGKKRGVRYYNFWGIAPKGADKKHPFFGITHFKKGFGGEEKELTPCQDLPISCRYWITWAIETIRRIKRGF